MTIRKYAVPIDDRLITLQGDPLCVGFQGDELYLWATHDESRAPKARRFDGVFTGRTVPEDGRYIGTAHQLHEATGPLVVHVFEVPE